jgi:D-serine deaminase-like pyridoxal phosphate-dependent protein
MNSQSSKKAHSPVHAISRSHGDEDRQSPDQGAATSTQETPVHLNELETPALILDRPIAVANVARMAARGRALSLPIRAHLKTPKSKQAMAIYTDAGIDRFCTSTIAETLAFASLGQTDIFYAIPLDHRKIERLAPALNDGAKIRFLIDHIEAARLCGNEAGRFGLTLSLFVEIDVDGYRTGIAPRAETLLPLIRLINAHPNLNLAGLMSYAGASYGKDVDGARQLAEMHRTALVGAQKLISDQGIVCPELSFGSTPAILHADHLDGMTEGRCGIFLFQDLFQAGIGACAIDDIAVSVLTTVISQDVARNQIVVDAGGLALSKDRSTQGRSFDAGFGLICEAMSGKLVPDLFVKTVSQELGLVTTLSGAQLPFAQFPIGSRLRILPNHADMTAAAYSGFHIVEGNDRIIGFWPRVNFW